MQIKNNMKTLFVIFLSLIAFNINLYGDEFDITAKEILINKEEKTLTGKGTVEAKDVDGNIITADTIVYKKSEEFLIADGNVKITDKEGNFLLSEKATFDKINGLITTYNDTILVLTEGYELLSKNIYYNTSEKILRSNQSSIFKDAEGNIIETSMFHYDIGKNLFSSIGDIKVKDIIKNKYFFKEIHVDTKKKEMIGSDVSMILDQENFGLTEESDPRFVANDIFISKNKTNLSKGVFTVCKLKEDKCPPWSLKAKKITHDKLKKTIYYKSATLKIYDIPIFYFPKFFHPDPTVKRQSGFLTPIFSLSSSLGTGSATPYYWAISKNKDLTFAPKIYTNENALFLNEYRQAFRNGFLTLDTSYHQGYKNITSKKTSGSRNHIFANLNFNFDEDDISNSSFDVKIQRTSNDTYFRVHDINTSLVNSENTNLENEISYNYNNSDMFVEIKANVFEDLTVKESSRYEYILPNITYGKTFIAETLGVFDFSSNAYYSNYETNRHKTFLVNDINWNPFSKITKNGFINSLQGMIRNTNYETKNTTEYKDEKTVNELQGVLSYKTSLPMKKDGVNYSKLFSPNFMLRFSPGHMRSLKSEKIMLNYSNIYALNKTSEVEDGLSAILGIDYSINEKNGDSETEKLSLSLGQVFSNEENSHLPAQSSLDQKTSDLVGKINYNFSEIGKIDYQFALDHNLNDFNYNDISTILNFGKIQFNLDYLEQQKHIGEEHYASTGLTLNFDENNKLSFQTKKNFKTDSTELYDLSYQYGIDCLTAGILYRREFYQDVDDLEPKDSLLFTITFVPFGSVKTPYIKQ